MRNSLINHERGYGLSFKDCLLSLGTGLSGAPYGVRHWQLSNTEAYKGTLHQIGHRVVAILECIPVAGALFALIERVIILFLKCCFKLEITISDFLKNHYINPMSKGDESLLKNAAKAIREHCAKDSAYANLFEAMPTLSTQPQKSLTITHTFADDIGPRPTMEDAHLFQQFDLGTLAAVFDGHGGSEVSKYAAKEFEKRFPAMLKSEKGHVRTAFTKLINQITEEVFKNKKWDHQGSTAVICFIDKKTNLIYTATLGDSEANIYRKIEGKLKSIALSCVRDWTSPKDFKRLANVYGEKLLNKVLSVFNNNPKVLRSRVIDGTNVSRAIGDKDETGTAQKPLVIHKAKITVNRLRAGDKLIIACDGLKDYVLEREVVQRIENHDPAKGTLAKNLVDFAVNDKSAKDNVTVLSLDIA